MTRPRVLAGRSAACRRRTKAALILTAWASLAGSAAAEPGAHQWVGLAAIGGHGGYSRQGTYHMRWGAEASLLLSRSRSPFWGGVVLGISQPGYTSLELEGAWIFERDSGAMPTLGLGVGPLRALDDPRWGLQATLWADVLLQPTHVTFPCPIFPFARFQRVGGGSLEWQTGLFLKVPIAGFGDPTR